MSRTGYGLRRIPPSRWKRLRDALAAIPSSTCDIRRCDLPASALVGGLLGYGFVCAGHAIQAEKLGYRVVRPGGEP